MVMGIMNIQSWHIFKSTMQITRSLPHDYLPFRAHSGWISRILFQHSRYGGLRTALMTSPYPALSALPATQPYSILYIDRVNTPNLVTVSNNKTHSKLLGFHMVCHRCAREKVKTLNEPFVVPISSEMLIFVVFSCLVVVVSWCLYFRELHTLAILDAT
jgi:hypothetical protein